MNDFLQVCPICDTDLHNHESDQGIFVCPNCGRKWKRSEEGWESVPMPVEADFSQLKEGVNYAEFVKKKPDLGLFDPTGIDTSSPEGMMLNAAMAILTTKYEPETEWMVMYRRVAELAKKIQADQKTDFEKELRYAINRNSKENSSDTPDFILADFLRAMLHIYGRTVRARDKWFNVDMWSHDKRGPHPEPVFDQKDVNNSMVTEK